MPGVCISMKETDVQQLLARLRELHKKCRPDEPWRIEIEPHNYPDGTTHFNHVRRTAHGNGEPLPVTIASHVTPELAELLVLMRNNLPELIRLARLGLDVVAESFGEGANISGGDLGTGGEPDGFTSASARLLAKIPRPAKLGGVIEIELSGARIRVEPGADPTTLCTVLAALRGGP